MKLSKNFTLEELIVSPTADEHGIPEQFQPSETVIQNLKELCINVLQPLREELGFPLTITSGYRCQRVNDLIKGATNSHHMRGMAADIQCHDNAALFEAAKKYKMTQNINEFNLSWVHISYDKNDLRCQTLEIK